jgi:N-acetylmuramoyl-L-alanine amidase
MRTIYLSAGHSTVSGRDRGASGNGFVEGVEAAKIRKRVAEILRQKYNCKTVIDPDDSILSQTIAYFRNKTTNRCIVVDIHFNAASPTATGTETLIDNNPTPFELDLAFALSHAASKTLGINKRGNFRGRAGVKSERESHHGSLGWMRLTGENALIEVCFISNKSDMDKYLAAFENYCQNIALVLYHFSIDTQKEVLNKI